MDGTPFTPGSSSGAGGSSGNITGLAGRAGTIPGAGGANSGAGGSSGFVPMEETSGGCQYGVPGPAGAALVALFVMLAIVALHARGPRPRS